ncbi:hypothetical protein D3C87_1580380 [compost metagenome]
MRLGAFGALIWARGSTVACSRFSKNLYQDLRADILRCIVRSLWSSFSLSDTSQERTCMGFTSAISLSSYISVK